MLYRIQTVQEFEVTYVVEASSPDEAWAVLTGDPTWETVTPGGRVVSNLDQAPGDITASRTESVITEDES